MQAVEMPVQLFLIITPLMRSTTSQTLFSLLVANLHAATQAPL